MGKSELRPRGAELKMRVPGFSPRSAWLGPNMLAIVVMIGCLVNTHEAFAEAPNYPVNPRDPWVSVGSEGCTDLLIAKPVKARVDRGISFETEPINSRGALHSGRRDTKAPFWTEVDEPIFRWREFFIKNAFQNGKKASPEADTWSTFPLPYVRNLLRKISIKGNTDNDYLIGVKFSFKGFDWMNSFGSLMISVGDSLTKNARSGPSSSLHFDIPEL